MSRTNKSTQQRRVKGHQHADPLASEDLLLDDVSQSTNTGLMGIMQQLKLHEAAVAAQGIHPSGGVALSQHVVAPPPSEDEIRQTAIVHVQKLFADKGEAGVQAMLQQQIQLTKKKESDIAVAKKRGEAAAREKEKLTADLHRITVSKTQMELQCKAMQGEIKKQDEDATRAAE